MEEDAMAAEPMDVRMDKPDSGFPPPPGCFWHPFYFFKIGDWEIVIVTKIK